MKTHTFPQCYGIAVDGEDARRFDDIFWVEKEGNEYMLYVCVPSMSQRDTRASPKYKQGFLFNQNIPSICFEFRIRSYHNTVGLKSFQMYECWAMSIANLHHHTHFASLPENIRTMLTDAGILVRALKHFFQKSGIFDFKGRSKELSHLLNTQFFMAFVNVVVANFAVHNKIPVLYYDLEKERTFEVNVGMLKLLPHYAQVTSPLRRIGDIVNQCNLMAFFKNIPYPLDYDDLAVFGFEANYLLHPRTFARRVKRQVVNNPPRSDIPKPVLLGNVIDEDYVGALETIYRNAQRPLPVYTYDNFKIGGRRSFQCTVLVVDLISSEPFSRTATATRKSDAVVNAAKDMYHFLIKRYSQKKAV